MTQYTLFGHQESGHTYKIHLALNYLNIPYEYITVNIAQPRPERDPKFRAIAKFGEVPVLVIDETAYVQSDAILCVIAEINRSLGGESQARMAQAREWLFWEANRLGLSLPHLRFAKKFSAVEYPQGSLDWLKQRFTTDINRLDEAFADGRAFILDDQPSIADFALAGYIFWTAEAGLTLPNRVDAWRTRISQLHGWRPVYTDI